MIDPHLILGIPRGAPPDLIRGARNRLARLFHPDRNDSEAATEMMRIVNLAYDLLTTGSVKPEYQPPSEPQNVDAFVPEAGFDCESCDFLITFGKHRGESMGNVARSDWKYLTWIAKNFDAEGWQSEVVSMARIALRHWSATAHEEQRRVTSEFRR